MSLQLLQLLQLLDKHTNPRSERLNSSSTTASKSFIQLQIRLQNNSRRDKANLTSKLCKQAHHLSLSWTREHEQKALASQKRITCNTMERSFCYNHRLKEDFWLDEPWHDVRNTTTLLHNGENRSRTIYENSISKVLIDGKTRNAGVQENN